MKLLCASTEIESISGISTASIGKERKKYVLTPNALIISRVKIELN